MRAQLKWIVVSLVLFGACLFAYARFSTLAADIQMHRIMEHNRVRHTVPRPSQEPPACYTDDCRARQVITI